MRADKHRARHTEQSSATHDPVVCDTSSSLWPQLVVNTGATLCRWRRPTGCYLLPHLARPGQERTLAASCRLYCGGRGAADADCKRGATPRPFLGVACPRRKFSGRPPRATARAASSHPGPAPASSSRAETPRERHLGTHRQTLGFTTASQRKLVHHKASLRLVQTNVRAEHQIQSSCTASKEMWRGPP